MLKNVLLKKEVYGPIIIILAAVIIYTISKKIITARLTLKRKDNNSLKRRLTVIKLFQNIFKYCLLIVSVLIILEIYGVNVQSIIAGLGIVGLVIGLALQDTIKDFLGGLSIIFDDYYAIGDWITFKGFKGEVIEFGLRSTKLKSNNGDVMTFANRNVTEIINFSKSRVKLILDFTVEITKANDKILNNIFNEILKLDNISKSESVFLGINQILGSNEVYRMEISCNSSKEFDIKRKALKIIKEEYDNNKLTTYPKVEVHNGNKV